ncbi:hypothetical protein ACQ86G_11565 [Roseateles chitinivorans]|uniref:hypothetical protein n=1 Tax=Roseateles chitinivorans TaxID=2917965 RepID=UPI003D670E80
MRFTSAEGLEHDHQDHQHAAATEHRNCDSDFEVSAQPMKIALEEYEIGFGECAISLGSVFHSSPHFQRVIAEREIYARRPGLALTGSEASRCDST